MKRQNEKKVLLNNDAPQKEQAKAGIETNIIRNSTSLQYLRMSIP